MNKIKLIIYKTVFIIGSIVTGVISLFLGLIIISLVYTMPQKIESTELYKKYSVDIADKVTGEVFLIRNEYGSATGFRPQHTNLFITNYHVVENMCSDSICSTTELKFNDNKDFYKFPLDVKVCSKWLDICILVPNGDKAVVDENLNDKVQSGESVFIIERDEFAKDRVLNPKVRIGSVVETTNSFAILNLVAQHGYSGSPIYNSKGEFVALISSLAFEKYKLPFLFLLGCSIRKFTTGKCSADFTKAVVLSVNEIKDLLDPAMVIKLEMNLLLEETKLYLEKKDCASFSIININSYRIANAFNEICEKNPHLNQWQRQLGDVCRSSSQYSFSSIDSTEADLVKFSKLYKTIKSEDGVSDKFCKEAKMLFNNSN